ncbi:17378_t:CDS:1, partial [Gigaspora margarita]
MNRNLTFAFILFVTLSVINATKWDTCSYNNQDIPALTVTLNPDPPVAGNLVANISGSIANSIFAFDVFGLYFFKFLPDGSYIVYYYFAYFLCGGEYEFRCEDPIEDDITLSLNITLDQTFDVALFEIVYITLDETVFPYLGCIHSDFRYNNQDTHDINDIKNLSSWPHSFLLGQKTFSDTSNIGGDKYKFVSINKYTSGYKLNSVNIDSGRFGGFGQVKNFSYNQ